MKQNTLFKDYDGYRKKKTRKERFLDDMDIIIQWEELCAAIAPFYPSRQEIGRRPVSIERMLRIYFLQYWFSLSDLAVEEALYDSDAMRRFVGIDHGEEPVPGETMICIFRHLMEIYDLGDRLFQLAEQSLEENGVKVNRGSIVDATMLIGVQ